MSESKHTRGPWHATGYEIRDYKGLITAVVHRHNEINMSLNEQRANAALIAAAPELLEACKMAVALLYAMGIYEATTTIGQKQFEYIQNIIAKAESKEEL